MSGIFELASFIPNAHPGTFITGINSKYANYYQASAVLPLTKADVRLFNFLIHPDV